jgi:integrase/recombinase XerD
MSQRSILLFEQAIKSEATKTAYKYQLNKFKEWAKIKSFDGLLQASPKDIQILLEDYVMYLKKTVSPNSIPIYFAPIELFYVMNDINVNFKKIRKIFPEKVKKGNERGYTREEIKTVLESAKTNRHKALVFLLVSSGCRIGAIPEIRLKHLSRIEDSYSIMIYEGDKQQDYIFTTPEATKVIDDYLDERKKDGEYIDEQTPLFRITYRLGIEKVRPCTTDNLTHIMGRLVSMIERKRTGKTKRFDIAKNHGFRKFYATIIKSTDGINPTMTEKLINHIGIVQMDGAYFTPSMETMFDSYKKAIPFLTISDEDRIKMENMTLKQEKSESANNIDKLVKEKVEEYTSKFVKEFEIMMDENIKKSSLKMEQEDIEFLRKSSNNEEEFKRMFAVYNEPLFSNDMS